MDPPPWGNNGPNSNVFGFEPCVISSPFIHQTCKLMKPGRNYPCCTVNHPQAYPKFWAHAFLADQSDASLVHAFLGPFTFSGIIGTSNDVKGTPHTLSFQR